MRTDKRVTDQPIQHDLSTLLELSREDLASQWIKKFGHPPPPRGRTNLLQGALAWEYQLAQQPNTDKKSINRMIKQLRRSTSTLATDLLAPGTRLLREWQGNTHHVTILAQGFEYDGKKYRSLTAIARHITGVSWSGPHFFGLRS